jgi:hypothetical protein
MKNTVLEDFKINVKIKLAFLWASVTFLYLYGDYFELYIPGKTSSLINGSNLLNSPAKLFLASLLLAVPALMVCFSILIKPRWNKWLNIIFGLFFTVIMLLIAVTSITEWRAFYVFYAILESILTSIIVWTAFNWPKQTNLTPSSK